MAEDILESVGTEFAVQKFLIQDFEFIQKMIEGLDVNFQKRLAETLFPLYEMYGNLKPFVNWSIQLEVRRTKRLSQLFRSDTFAVQLINNLLFGDLGIKFLKYQLQAILDFVLQEAITLSLVKEPKEEHEIVARNKILKILDELLDRMEKSLVRCPIFLRDLFAIISKCVTEAEFQDGKAQTSFVLSFICFRYICPVLVNPAKYALIDDELSANHQTGLISISKLLNDLSLCNKDKYDKRTGEWISSRFQRLCTYLKSLLDEEEIETAKLMIESSVEPQKYSENEKNVHLKLLRNFFNDLNPRALNNNRAFSSNSMAAKLALEGDSNDRVTKFFFKMNHPEWKLKKENSSFKFWKMKEKANPVHIFKIEMTIHRNLKDVAQNYNYLYFDSRINKVYTQEDWYHSSDGNRSILYSVINMPIPFQNRDICILMDLFELADDCYLSIQEESRAIPVQKSFTRAQLHLSGSYFKALSPFSTQVTILIHFDEGGSIPKWIMNRNCSRIVESHLIVKEIFEKDHFNPENHKKFESKPLK